MSALGWHVHMPGALDPLPPWYSEPHSLTCLIYLNDVTPTEGALRLAPGSHRDRSFHPSDDSELDETSIALLPHCGDCVLAHGNLWHRTDPPLASARNRTLLLVMYTPAWLEPTHRISGQAAIAPDEHLRTTARRLGVSPSEFDELTGRFNW